MKKYLFGLLVMVLVGCSGTKVLHTELGDNVDLRKYKTFDFYQVRASGDTVSALFTERINLLKEAISHELERRGYQYNSNHPDLLVNIGVRVKEEIQTRQTDWRTDGAPRYIGQRNYSWKSQEIEVGRYREGTAAIHLVDAAQQKLVWKGVVQGIVPDKHTDSQAEAQKGIQLLFEKFPVPVKQ
jgi:hypothetical protein